MARSSEDCRTEIESPNTQHSVPVVSHVSDLISLDPQSELFLETPPPDVVSCISACFEQFTSTLERRDASVHKSSDSDSGESLFITQSVTKAVRTERRDGSTKRPESISDDSEGVANSRSKNEGNRYQEGSEGQHVVCPKGQKRIHYFPPQKATFPFLLKLHRRQHLPRKKHQILENSEMGGFLKCMKKFEEGYVKTERAISPYMLESELSDDTEGDDHNNDHEVTKVDKTIFVPSYHKGNFNKWYSQSILESWIQDSLSKDNNNDQLLNVNEKENKTHFTKKKQTSGSVKKQSNKKCKVPKSKAVAKTVPESSCVSLSEERGKHETHEVFTSCSDAEPSDSSNCGQPLNNQVIQCAENSDGNNFEVIEETRAHSVEAVSQIQHEDDMRSGTDNDLPNKSNDLILPQGGDISVQNEIQQTDSDFGSLDLFSPLNSPEHKINQIHKTASITANMESDQDSDVTQIETEGQFESIFGPGTLSWGDGEHPAHENDESDITEMETEESVFVFGPRTLTKQFTVQNVNCTKLSETQKTGQSSVVLHTELETRPKKKKTKSSSHKDTEVTGIEETVNVQPSSEQIPLADEPLREVYSSSCEHFIVGKRRKMEIETYTQDSPLFKNCEMTFLKRKRKSKKKMGAAVLIECDTNVDVSQTENSEFQVDVAELKTTCRENGELCDVENRVTNEEQIAALVLQSEETSELLEEILSTLADGGVIKKAKKKKIMCKLKVREDAEPGVENQSVEVVQFSEPQTTELTLKRTKKKRKDKERVKTAYAEENSAIDTQSNGTLDSDRPTELRVNKRNQSSEAPEAGQPKHMQTSEEIARWVLPNITRLKSVKKKKKKERDETESRNESVDLNMSSMSQFDASLRVDEQREDQGIQERWSNDNAGEHLEGITASIFNVAKCKKSVNVRSPSQSDYIIGPEKHVSCMQSENTAEPNNLGSDDMFITKEKQKNAKKQKLKKRKTIELASDIEDMVQFQYSESQTTDLLTRRTKQKRTKKDRERTVSSSNEHLEHMDDRPPEMRGIHVIQSSEATETDQIEHTQSSKGISRDPSPSETILSSAKKRKKKRDASSVSQGSLGKKKKDQSKECQNESIDLNLDVSSVSQESLGKKKKKRDQSKECQNESVGLNLDASSVPQESLGKKKKKKGDQSKEYQNESVNLNLDASSVSQESLGKKKKKKRDQSKEYQNESVHLNLDVSFVSQESLGKKKKKKRDQSKEYQNESVHLNLDVSSVSQESLGKKKKKKRDQSKECQNESVDLNLDASSVSQESLGKKKKKKGDQSKEYQNESVNLNLDASSVSQESLGKKKKKKRDQSKEYQNESVHLNLDVSFVSQGSLGKKKKKKRDQSKEYQNESVHLNLDVSSVSQESLGKKKKKKRDQSKECQNESVDLNLDASSVSQFDVTALRAQKMIERQSNAAENLEGNAAHILNITKLKNKSQNASAPSQVDIIGLENSVSDSQSGSTAELVEKTNSSILSDNTLNSKYKWNKKKKHKLKEQEDAKSNAVTHSVDNVHSVEMDQFSESQTAELTLKGTKKKRKDKERKKAAYIEENGTTDVLSVETFETETDHSEHLQTSEQAEQYLLPNVTRIKSLKKKKKKSASEVYQLDSLDFSSGCDFGVSV